jgi:hypothetical protein
LKASLIDYVKKRWEGDKIMISRHKLGLVFGTFLGAWHFVWAWLVLSGMAQSLMNWIFRLHFIEPPYTIRPFNFGMAIALIVITSITGYLSGWVLAAIWNWLRVDTSSPAAISAVRRRQPATGH